MKKSSIAYAICLSLIPFIGVSADFPSSGVDMDASTVTIANYVAAPEAGTFSCLGSSAVPQAHTFNEADWNEITEVFDNLADCFGYAGEYTLNIHLQDNAGNFNDYTENFTTIPSTPTSAELSDCTPKVANNIDECVFTLTLKDSYDNETTGQSPTVYSPSGNFADDANTGIEFRDGLRTKGDSATYEVLPTSAGIDLEGVDNNIFRVRAIAPSIQQVGTSITELGANWLANVISREINFGFSNIREVEANGSLGATISNLFIEKPLTFSNPFFSEPSISDLEHEALVTTTTRTNKESNFVINTNTSRNIKLESKVGVFCDLTDADANGEYDMTNCGSIDYDFDPTATLNTVDGLAGTDIIDTYDRVFNEPGSAVIGENSAALTTAISYLLGGQTVSYPSGAVGGIFTDLMAATPTTIGLNLESIGGKFIGADIEGFTSVDAEKSVLGTTNDQILNIGINYSEVDLYEKIVKNGWSLARNSANNFANNDESGSSFADNLFTSSANVAVVDLSSANNDADKIFEISGDLPEGKKTIVLINGNLKVSGDLAYQNDGDSFGVILLRSAAGVYPTVGNIFVGSGVQNIAGSYFADGGFMNNDGNTIAEGNTAESTDQLLLQGALLSRNTLGGSLRGSGQDDYSPWADDATNEVARQYDLHYVRRYDYEDVSHNGISGETNTNAFIIRPDQKSTILPPPGFKIN